MAHSFKHATAVTSAGEDKSDETNIGVAGESRRYDATVFPEWDIGGNANGGYLLAIAGRAMGQHVGRPPVTLTAHYLAPVQDGPATIEVQTVRAGRAFATATAQLCYGGKVALSLVGTFGEQREHELEYSTGAPPDLPAFDDPSVIPTDQEIEESPNIHRHIVSRLRPGDAGFRTGTKSGRALVAGWFDLIDGEPIDEYGLLLAADAFPPPVFNLDLPVGWVPTIELTVHIRGVPAPGPLRCRFETNYISNGLLSEDGELWDSAGRLVAQSRQMALLPREPLAL